VPRGARALARADAREGEGELEGLTLIQRAAGTRPPRNPKIALVLAGGAVSGGAFKVGGLRALDECLIGRRVNDFDLYVGLSAGAFLATSLAAGITPVQMIEALEGTSKQLTQLRPIDFYRPALGELRRPLRFGSQLAGYLPGLLLDFLSVLPELPARIGPSVSRLVERPSYTQLETLLLELVREISPKREFPALGALIPSGFFDNSALERWLADNMAATGTPNRFADLYRQTGHRLFITATDLDSAARVVFGPAEDHGVSISQAVQASSALPGFFRPVRLNGIDYVDGGVHRTANIDLAIDHGADLVICYNPFRPFLNVPGPGNGRRHLSERGFQTVMSQVFRTMLHTRLAMGLRVYLHDESFRGDIVVIEARESDEQFFDLNPLNFWKRSEAIQHGFDSVQRTLLDHAEVLGPLFESYGLELRLPGCGDTRAPTGAGEGLRGGAEAGPGKESPGLRLLGVREVGRGA
jgi:predicted acylesterase/phospholipase RssA